MTSFDIAEHIPCKFSHFYHYFVNYGGFILVYFVNYGGFKNLPESKYRSSSIPNDGLEIPITLNIKKGNSTRNVFEKKGKKALYWTEENNKKQPWHACGFWSWLSARKTTHWIRNRCERLPKRTCGNWSHWRH